MYSANLDTLLTLLYTIIDDIYQEHFAPHRPARGRPCKFSDSEVLTVAILAQWMFNGCESQTIDYINKHWTEYFPDIITKSAFNKRVRYLSGCMTLMGPLIADLCNDFIGRPSAHYEVLDGVGIPLKSLARSRRSDIINSGADVGKSGVPRSKYCGFKALVSIHPYGWFNGSVYGPASTDERWLSESYFRFREDPTLDPPNSHEMDAILGPRHRKNKRRKGPSGRIERDGVGGNCESRTCLSDLGLRGRRWEEHWLREYGVAVLHKGHLEGACPWRRWFMALRQKVEQAIGAMGQGKAQTALGCWNQWSCKARIAARIAKHNLSCLANLYFGRPCLAAIDVLTF